MKKVRFWFHILWTLIMWVRVVRMLEKELKKAWPTATQEERASMTMHIEGIQRMIGMNVLTLAGVYPLVDSWGLDGLVKDL